MISKKNFPFFDYNPETIYLDAAATTLKPASVIETESEWYKRYNAPIHRGLYKTSVAATKRYEESREIIASHFNVLPQEVVFVKNATEGINLISHGIAHSIKEGSTIVVSLMEHHSNLLPWIELAKNKKAELKIIPLIDGRIDESALETLITRNTSLVAVNHGSNTLGTITPIEKIALLTKQYKIPLIVDGTQIPAHAIISPWLLGADAYIFSGHKMYGPEGTGVILARKQLLSDIEPTVLGGDMVESVSLEYATYQPAPYRFEAGTQNAAGANALACAVNFIRENIAQIQETDQILTKETRTLLEKHERIQLLTPLDAELPLTCFVIEGIHPHDVASLLDEWNICVRAGFACAEPIVSNFSTHGIVRISTGIWNTKSDIELFNEALSHILKNH